MEAGYPQKVKADHLALSTFTPIMSFSTVKEGQPFSATYNRLRGSAGGMNDGKCDTEFKDNSFDAGATYANKKIFIDVGRIYVLLYDNGRGCPCLPHLFGLGETMPRKMDNDSCGLFNHGHTAAIAFHNPEIVYTETICDGKFGSLTFQAAKFAEDIDKNPDDMGKANITKYMKSNEERLRSDETLMKKCISNVSNPIMRQQLEDILNGVSSNYTLTIMKLLPGSELPDDCSKAFTANERMYYYRSLCNNRTIMLETSDSKIETADASNAIDPLSDRKKFKVLESIFTVKKSTCSDSLIGKLILKNAGNDNDIRTLYIYKDHDGRRTFPVVMERCPEPEWNEESPTLMTLTGVSNAISEGEAESQLNKLYNVTNKKARSTKNDSGFNGSDFKTIDDLRGVMVEFAHRILGKPYWRKGAQDIYGWGAERNSGNARCCIKVEGDKSIIAHLMGFQMSKHNTDLDKCNPIIIRYLYCIYGILIQKYTICTINESNNPITKNGKTTPWDLTELVHYIMGRTVRKPARILPAIVPRSFVPDPLPVAPTPAPIVPVAHTTAPVVPSQVQYINISIILDGRSSCILTIKAGTTLEDVKKLLEPICN